MADNTHKNTVNATVAVEAGPKQGGDGNHGKPDAMD